MRELKNDLSRYVQQVADGAEVTITMRGKPVARIVPIPEDDYLVALRERGILRPAKRPKRPRTKRDRIDLGVSLSEFLDEQRR